MPPPAAGRSAVPPRRRHRRTEYARIVWLAGLFACTAPALHPVHAPSPAPKPPPAAAVPPVPPVPPVPVDPAAAAPLDQAATWWLWRLASSAPAVRGTAAEDTQHLAALESALRAGTAPKLTVHQQQLVAALLRARFLRTPRGALGVRFDPSSLLERSSSGTNPDGPVIADTIDGFASVGVFQPGDTLLKIDGRTVPIGAAGATVVRTAVIARDPGETITLTLLRAGTRTKAEVELGSLKSLAVAGSYPGPAVLEAAWSIRRRFLGLEPHIAPLRPAARTPPSSSEAVSRMVIPR